MLFAHLKRILRLDRLRLQGPNGAKDEFLLAATAQNLRKLAKLVPLSALIVAAEAASQLCPADNRRQPLPRPVPDGVLQQNRPFAALRGWLALRKQCSKERSFRASGCKRPRMYRKPLGCAHERVWPMAST
jgi:hypothetical protein